MQACLREVCFLAAVYEFEIRAVHIKGEYNRLPDSLSCWESGYQIRNTFCERTKDLKMTEVSFSEELFSFIHSW